MDTTLSFQKGLRDGLPICMGYVSVAFTFGLMVAENGLPAWIAVLISGTNLTSAGQFAGTALILSGGLLLEIAVTTFIINLRYTLMSLSLSQRLDPSMPMLERCLLAFGITDEVFAVAMQQEHSLTAPYLFGLILTPYLGWFSGTLAGATATGLLPLTVRSALGIAIYGMFIAILIPPCMERKPVAITVILSCVLCCLLRYLPGLRNLSGGWVIILCAVVVSSLAALRFPVDCENDAAEKAAERAVDQP